MGAGRDTFNSLFEMLLGGRFGVLLAVCKAFNSLFEMQPARDLEETAVRGTFNSLFEMLGAGPGGHG